jgi:hypothetical protein
MENNNYTEIFTKDFGEYISRSGFNWFNEETKDHTYNNESKVMSLTYIDSSVIKNKTKVIACLRKDRLDGGIEKLAEEGIRAFHISGASFKYHEYKKLVRDIKTVYSRVNEIPSFIFDLKGSAPYITRLEGNKGRVKMKTGQIIKITFDNAKIKDEGIIFIDKKISHMINEGEMIYISSSDVILKVTGKERYPSQNGYRKTHSSRNIHKSSESWKEEFQTLYKEEGSFGEFCLTQIKEEESEFSIDQDEKLLFEVNNFDSYFEERLINRQASVNKAYKNIIKKHDKGGDWLDKSSHYSFGSSSKCWL